MSTTNDERPPARRRAAPQLPDPMSPVAPAQPAPTADTSASVAPAHEDARSAPTRAQRTATPKVDPYDQEQWSGFTAALGGRVAVEAKELLAPLAKAYGLKTERAVIERLVIDAARAKLPDGPPAR